MPNANRAILQPESGFLHTVGTLDLVADGPAAYDVTAHAFDGDMAPNQAVMRFEGDGIVYFVRAPLVADAEYVLDPVEQLEPVAASTFEDISVTWDAPDYPYLGASISNQGAPGSWYVYSYGRVSASFTLDGWPALPEGMVPDDINFGAATDVNASLSVFAAGYEEGVAPWEFSEIREQRAVLVAVDIVGGL